MIRAERIEVGTDPVDLTEGTGLSGASIQFLRNAGKGELFIGEGDAGIPIPAGEQFPMQLTLNSTDHLTVYRKKGSGPVDVIVGSS